MTDESDGATTTIGRGSGKYWENWACNMLEENGIAYQKMKSWARFDILALGRVRIDVKSSGKPVSYFSQFHKAPKYNFLIGDEYKHDYCDIYLAIIAETGDYFVIPAHAVPKGRKVITLSYPPIDENDIYAQYYRRLDLIQEMSESLPELSLTEIENAEKKSIYTPGRPKMIGLRVDLGLYEKIKQVARIENRSINAQVVYMLEQVFSRKNSPFIMNADDIIDLGKQDQTTQ